MARIRTTKPEFWEDEKVGTLSRDARLLFLATWNVADDEGLLRWNPAYLKAEAFRYDWDITEAAVRDMMRELSFGDFVVPYCPDAKGEMLAWIVNFRRHQRINRPQPGRHVPPDAAGREVLDAFLRRDKYTCYVCREPVPPTEDAPPSGGAAPVLRHLVPLSEDGTNYPTNLVVVHGRCTERAMPDHIRNSARSVNQHGTTQRRNALTSDNGFHEPFTEHSVADREREQGKGRGKEPPAVAVRDAEPITAQAVTAAWVDRIRDNGTKPTQALIGQVARTAKQLIDRGNDPQRVLDAARMAAAKGFATIERELLRTNGDPDAERRDPNTGRIVDWA